MHVRSQDPFESMLHRYRGLIFSICRRYGQRGIEVDDLLQDVAMALWRNREKLLDLPKVQQAALIWKMGRRKSQRFRIARILEPE